MLLLHVSCSHFVPDIFVSIVLCEQKLLVTPLSLAGLITSLVSSCIVECRESFPRCCFSSLTRKKKKRDEREGRKRRRKRSERRKEMRRKSSKNDRCKQPAEPSCESSAARRANHSESSKEENNYQEAPKRSLSKKRQHTFRQGRNVSKENKIMCWRCQKEMECSVVGAPVSVTCYLRIIG